MPRSKNLPGMKSSTIKFSTFPRTEPPPSFVEDVVTVFRQHEAEIATQTNDKGLKSDDVLALLGPDLAEIGFQVEASKKKVDKLEIRILRGERHPHPPLRDSRLPSGVEMWARSRGRSRLHGQGRV